jgi:hypothetical protein
MSLSFWGGRGSASSPSSGQVLPAKSLVLRSTKSRRFSDAQRSLHATSRQYRRSKMATSGHVASGSAWLRGEKSQSAALEKAEHRHDGASESGSRLSFSAQTVQGPSPVRWPSARSAEGLE